MMSEPKDGKLSLVVTNDSRQDEKGSYEVVDITTDKVVAHGNYTVESDGKLTVDVINENKEAFYLIKWTYSGGTGVNHFTANIGENWTYEKYKTCMQKAGFYDEFEGFEV